MYAPWRARPLVSPPSFRGWEVGTNKEQRTRSQEIKITTPAFYDLILASIALHTILQASSWSYPLSRVPTMLVSLTVGKVDAGVAVLLTDDNRLVR